MLPLKNYSIFLVTIRSTQVAANEDQVVLPGVVESFLTMYGPSEFLKVELN